MTSRPGDESYRKTREDLTTMDKLHMALTELSYSVNYTTSINVWEYSFAPREYLNQHLETRFARALAGMVMFSPETSEIAKPSELLTSVRAYMNVLQSVENYIHVDMTRIFNNVLLQQTQQTDSNGEPTIGNKLLFIFISNWTRIWLKNKTNSFIAWLQFTFHFSLL